MCEKPQPRVCQVCGARIMAGLFCGREHFEQWQHKVGGNSQDLYIAYRDLEDEVLDLGD